MSRTAAWILAAGLAGLLLGGLLGFVALSAIAAPVAAQQPAWNWQADSQESRLKAAPTAPVHQESPGEGEAAEKPAEKSAEKSAENSAGTGVAGAISGIMGPNDGNALSNDARIEALRRRAQTGQPLRP